MLVTRITVTLATLGIPNIARKASIDVTKGIQEVEPPTPHLHWYNEQVSAKRGRFLDLFQDAPALFLEDGATTQSTLAPQVVQYGMCARSTNSIMLYGPHSINIGVPCQ